MEDKKESGLKVVEKSYLDNLPAYWEDNMIGVMHFITVEVLLRDEVNLTSITLKEKILLPVLIGLN